ncbi:MAG TPA: hypothetical protein VFG42_22365 [Baekduia sp.]|uniref:hypothetical protein n=1 Tax=Baekduia sp. TaxID=2600305 RepID=UPI002D76B779|nr:hypothetical protein [Baekduia sp.]HET6509560.1 hypothetical protein [Baekduia sp.]
MPITHDMPFRGQAHQAVVEQLLADHAQVIAAGRPRLSVVAGAPGVGKSRVLLELYRALAADQDDPAYWPAPDAEWSGYPPDVQPGKALMTFFWWGISCPSPAGQRTVQILGDRFTQVAVHGEILVAEQRVATTASGEVTGGAKDLAAGVLSDLVPGGATAVALGRSLLRVVGAGARERSLRHRLAEGAVLDATDAERRDLVERSVEILDLLAERVPVVVAVDDAQWSDPSLRRLLEEISAGVGPVHVVLVLQEAAIDDPWLAELMARFPARALHDLGELSEGDALALVSGAAPNGPLAVARALARKSSGNPRSLSLLLQLAQIHDGEIRAGLTDVAEMADRFADQLAVVWDEILPPSVKRVLSAGALTATRAGSFYVPPVLDALPALDALPTLDGEAATADGLREVVASATRRGWLQRQGDVARFDQPQHGTVARTRTVLLRDQREAVLDDVAGRLVELGRTRAIDRLPLDARRVALETHVRLARDGRIDDPLVAADAAFDLSALLAEAGDTTAALPLRREAIDWARRAGVTDRQLLNLRSTLLDLLRREGHEEELDALLDELAATTDEETAPLWQLNALAQRLRSDGPTAEGVDELRRLARLADDEDPGGRLALFAHANLGYFLNRLEEHDAALAEYETVRDRIERGATPGPELSVFRTDLNIAATLRYRDGIAASLAAFDALDAVADDRQREQATIARLNMLVSAVEAGASFDEVFAPLEEAFTRARAELGSGRRAVRGAVNVLGNLLLTAGRVEQALDCYERFPTRLGLPSADDVDAATTFNHASALMRLERDAEAVPLLEGVMSATMRSQPPGSEMNYTVVSHLVHAAAEAGRDDPLTAAVIAYALALGSADAWGQLAAERLHALDATTRDHGHPGRVPEALREAGALLVGLGDPVGILYTGLWAANMFLMVERYDDAVPAAHASIAAATALGHEDARLAALITIGEAQRAQGQTTAALATYREIADAAAAGTPPGDVARRRLAELRGT